MPKPPSLTSEAVIKILLKNGFELDHQTWSHRVYYNPEKKRRMVVFPIIKKTFPGERCCQFSNRRA